jgi:hypothetical protein
MILTRRSFLAALLVCSLGACREAPPLPPERAILVLVSIDGFRADYLDRFKPPTLSKLAEQGVQAEGLIPQFPSKTFPNHHTQASGPRGLQEQRDTRGVRCCGPSAAAGNRRDRQRGLVHHVEEGNSLCAVLGLQPASNDGDPAVTRDMLRSNR